MIKQVFLFVAFLLVNTGVFAQKDTYDQLKTQYDTLRKAENYESALLVAKQMNSWALKNETDTSLRYAVSLRYVGNCYYILDNNKLALSFWKASSKSLENNSRVLTEDNFLALKYIGHLYIQEGEIKNAEGFIKRAQIICETIYTNNFQNHLDFLEETAIEYEDIYRYEDAIRYYNIILDYLIRIDKQEIEYYSEIQSLLGVAYFMNGNFLEAKKILQKASELSLKTFGIDNIYYANDLVNLGLTHVELGEFEQAIQCYDNSIRIYSDSKKVNKKNFAKILNNYANLLSDLDRYDDAEKKYLEAIKIYIENNAQLELSYAQCLLNYSILKAEKECFTEAKILMSKSLSIIRMVEGEKSPDYINTLVNLATLKGDMGEIDSAIFDFNMVANLCSENLRENDEIYLNCLFGLGNLYHDIGQFQKSEIFLLKSAEGYKKKYGEQSLNYTKCLNSLGALYMDIGSLEKSEKILREAAKFNSQFLQSNHSMLLAINFNLATLMVQKEDLFSARNILENQKDLIFKIYGKNHSISAHCYNNLGSIYNDLKEDSLAISNYKEAIRVYSLDEKYNQEDISKVLFNLGNFYADLNSFTNAYDCYSKSLQIQENIEGENSYLYSDIILNLGILLWKNENYIDGGLKFREVAKIIDYNLSSNFSWLSAQDKQAYWQQEKDFYDNMNSFSVSAVDSVPSSTELSYNANLISKSLLLETSRELDQAVSQSTDEEMKAQFTEMKQLRKLFSKMQSEGSTNKEIMERYKTQADSLDKILVNKLGEYAASKRKFEITWKDVQSNLTTSDAAIEFARYYDDKDSLYKYMALVVRPDYEYPKLVKLGEEEQIRVAVSTKDFAALYSMVWQGIDSLLTGVKTVYYSPAGEFNNVAFSALCFESSDDKLAVSGNQTNRGVEIQSEKTSTQSCNLVLLDKYELHQLTTTRYLADGTLKKEKPMQPSLALVGGINFDDVPDQTNEAEKEQSNEDFALQANLRNRTASTNGKKRGKRSSSNYGKKMDPLPGTKEEVVNIAGLLNTSNWKVQTKSDKKAGEYEFKKELETKTPGVLHIATHGFAFPDEAKEESKLMDMNQTSTYKVSEDPMVRCGLMFSGSNISWTGNPQKMIEQTGDDGILTAAEVANLDLSQTKLVVLSACETGLGKIEGSEGTFGLKRGFKLAGVEQMIVSLWSVPDKETMELMTLFYTDLAKTLNPVISFSNAQKEMRLKYPIEPEKWAGFVLVR